MTSWENRDCYRIGARTRNIVSTPNTTEQFKLGLQLLIAPEGLSTPFQVLRSLLGA